jgi:hypothetical protein
MVQNHEGMDELKIEKVNLRQKKLDFAFIFIQSNIELFSNK